MVRESIWLVLNDVGDRCIGGNVVLFERVLDFDGVRFERGGFPETRLGRNRGWGNGRRGLISGRASEFVLDLPFPDVDLDIYWIVGSSSSNNSDWFLLLDLIIRLSGRNPKHPETWFTRLSSCLLTLFSLASPSPKFTFFCELHEFTWHSMTSVLFSLPRLLDCCFPTADPISEN